MLRFIAVKDRSQPVVMDRSFSGLSFPRVKDRDQWSGLFPVQSGPVCGLFAVLGPDLQTLPGCTRFWIVLIWSQARPFSSRICRDKASTNLLGFGLRTWPQTCTTIICLNVSLAPSDCEN